MSAESKESLIARREEVIRELERAVGMTQINLRLGRLPDRTQEIRELHAELAEVDQLLMEV